MMSDQIRPQSMDALYRVADRMPSWDEIPAEFRTDQYFKVYTVEVTALRVIEACLSLAASLRRIRLVLR